MNTMELLEEKINSLESRVTELETEIMLIRSYNFYNCDNNPEKMSLRWA